MSTLKTREEGDVLVVNFADAKIIDDARIQEIGNELLESASRATSGRMLVNFQGVGFMSSAMIGKLVLLNRKCKENDVDLKLCNISPNVFEVFKIMRLTRVFDIHADEAKAIKAFDKKGWFG